MVPENVKEPYKFELFHPATKDPLDLYTWGNDFFRPLVEMDKSLLAGKENLDKIVDYLAKGENVFLLSNHQTEADPQVISLLMEREGYGKLASGLINVAGHRVTTDHGDPLQHGQEPLLHLLQEVHREPPRAQGREAEAQRANAKKDGRDDGEKRAWREATGGPGPCQHCFRGGGGGRRHGQGRVRCGDGAEGSGRIREAG
ncbi:unnamed protein product [Ascophyllum nodosum]